MRFDYEVEIMGSKGIPIVTSYIVQDASCTLPDALADAELAEVGQSYVDIRCGKAVTRVYTPSSVMRW